MTTVSFDPIARPWLMMGLIIGVALVLLVLITWALRRSFPKLPGIGLALPALLAAPLLTGPMLMLFDSAELHAVQRLDAAVADHYRTTADLSDTDLRSTGAQALTLLNEQGHPVLCVLTVDSVDLDGGAWTGSLGCQPPNDNKD